MASPCAGQDRFATKPALALAMIERALASNVPFLCGGRQRYGVGDIEMALKRAAKAMPA